jgi:hypothetical protein
MWLTSILGAWVNTKKLIIERVKLHQTLPQLHPPHQQPPMSDIASQPHPDVHGLCPPAPACTPPPQSPPSPPCVTDDDASSTQIVNSGLLADPLKDIPSGANSALEVPLRRYLLDMPMVSTVDHWDTQAGAVWLETGTVRFLCFTLPPFLVQLCQQNAMIRKLRAVDPDLGKLFLDRILLLQDFVDNAIRKDHAFRLAREKEKQEAIRQAQEQEAVRQAEEHLRFVVQMEEKRRADEERAKVEKEEAAQKDRKEVEELLASGLRGTTYPTVSTGKCSRCTARKFTCIGLAGKSCEECTNAHTACSNSGTFEFLIYNGFKLTLNCSWEDQSSGRPPR